MAFLGQFLSDAFVVGFVLSPFVLVVVAWKAAR